MTSGDCESLPAGICGVWERNGGGKGEEESWARHVRLSFPAGPEGSNCVWMCVCHGLSLGGETLRLQTPMVGLLG